MSEPIKAGDLVYIKRGCCNEKYSGEIRTIRWLFVSGGSCQSCGAPYAGQRGAAIDGIADHTFHVSWLKRIPPLGELDDEKRDEEITA